jgi:hypothetical protein
MIFERQPTWRRCSTPATISSSGERLVGGEEVSSPGGMLRRTVIIEIRGGRIFTITNPVVIEEMVSLILQSEETKSLNGLPTSHDLTFYKEGWEEEVATWMATPATLRALGEVPGALALIRYNCRLNKFYFYHARDPWLQGRFFDAPLAFKELLAAEYRRRGLELRCP